MIIAVRCLGNIASVVNETTSSNSVSPRLSCASLWKSLLQSRQFKKVSAMPPGGHLARLPLWGNLRPGTTFNQLDNFRNHARNTVALVACRPKLNEPTPAPSRWITMRRFPEKVCIIRNLTVRERERERREGRGRFNRTMDFLLAKRDEPVQGQLIEMLIRSCACWTLGSRLDVIWLYNEMEM